MDLACYMGHRASLPEALTLTQDDSRWGGHGWVERGIVRRMEVGFEETFQNQSASSSSTSSQYI